MSAIWFEITFEDDSTLRSHDEMMNETKVHAHALPPHSKKMWKSYKITHDNTKNTAEVDFNTGMFKINGIPIRPATDDGHDMSYMKDEQEFEGNEQWSFLNGLKYYPVVGKRKFFCSDPILYGGKSELTLPFCGWKRKMQDRVIQKVAFMLPDGEIMLT